MTSEVSQDDLSPISVPRPTPAWVLGLRPGEVVEVSLEDDIHAVTLLEPSTFICKVLASWHHQPSRR